MHGTMTPARHRTAHVASPGTGPSQSFRRPTTHEEFLHAGRPVPSDLDYDVPFIPVVTVTSPIHTGMGVLLSWFANWLARRRRRNRRTEAPGAARADPGTLLQGVQ